MPVRLELHGPDGCVSLRDLLGAIQRRNGRVRLAAGAERAVALSFTVKAVDAGLQGELQVRADDGSTSSRRVEGATCQAVVEALSLTAALALESVAYSPPAPLAPAPRPLASRSPAPPARPASSPSRLRAFAGAQASLGQMLAPHLNAGGGLLGRARLERGRLVSPSLTLLVSHSRNELFESSRHAAVHLTGVSLTACPVALRPASPLRLEPCLTATGARLSATGRELPLAEAVSRSWWGVGALARASLELLAELSLEVEGGALLPLTDRRFIVVPSGRALGTTPALAPFATVGLAYAL
jgi:hypothetical protein